MPLSKKILIIGYGSIGIKHSNILSRIVGKKNIYIFSKNKSHTFNKIEFLDKNLQKNIDYIIISSKTSDHLKHLKLVDNIFLNKKVLIEKPLYKKDIKLNFNNNKYYVAYNLRYHPGFSDLNKFIKKRKVLNVNIQCLSDINKWKNFSEYNNYNLKKNFGGGVHLDLSHEIDYLFWIFGKIKKYNFLLRKLSDSTIDSFDLLNLNGTLENGGNFHLSLNYFSKIEKRELHVDCGDISFLLKFVDNTLQINSKKNNNKFIKYKFKINDTFKLMHLDILKNDKPIACSLFESNQILKLFAKK